jgi:mono/diheme cytochrome c family protein
MKLTLKIIVLFVCLSTGGFGSAKKIGTGLTASEASDAFADSPRGLYSANCARCHGADGKSETTLGRLNDAPDISSGKLRSWSGRRLTALIRSGKGSMPGFGKKLARADIAALTRYIREL